MRAKTIGILSVSAALTFGAIYYVGQGDNIVPGAIEGEFKVDNSGAGTYNIPIQVPPGTASMQPEIALVYSSHYMDGLPGHGWQLHGFSAINRCLIRRDGGTVSHPIAYDNNDRFCLDGEPLVNISSASYGDRKSVV